MNTADVLDAAADVMERRGLYQGDYCGPDGSVCVGGALRLAVGRDVRDLGSVIPHDMGAAEAFARAATGKPYAQSIAGWNDTPGRTKEEVVAMLRAVAAVERARAARLMPVIVTPSAYSAGTPSVTAARCVVTA